MSNNIEKFAFLATRSNFIQSITPQLKPCIYPNKLALYQEQVNLGSRTVLDPNSINYCESIGNYTFLYPENKERILLSTTLGSVEDRLLENGMFVRLSRRYLVNFKFIKKFELDCVTLKNALEIKVPRRKREFVFSKLNALLN